MIIYIDTNDIPLVQLIELLQQQPELTDLLLTKDYFLCYETKKLSSEVIVRWYRELLPVFLSLLDLPISFLGPERGNYLSLSALSYLFAFPILILGTKCLLI